MEIANIPHHVAIIMDGNGRWAQSRGRPRIFGHKEGAKRVRDVLEAAGECGVKALTLFAFSEENWNRPETEVSALLGLLVQYLKKEIAELNAKNVKLRVIGDVARLPLNCQILLTRGERLTENNTGIVLTIALSYSGRMDIVKACKSIAEQVERGELTSADVDHDLVAQNLFTKDLPDPDLLIRTSGEQRISNFLLWQLAYTELYFSPVYWPEFDKACFLEAICSYSNRARRFGRVEPLEVPPTAPSQENKFYAKA
ncbi:MAG: isoprenyl transferase [Oligoflexales bacterium]